MKRFLALVLSCCLLLSSCGQRPNPEVTPEAASPLPSNDISVVETVIPSPESSSILAEFKIPDPEYPTLNDPALLTYLEDNIYSEVVGSLNSSDYFVENVSAVYISKEYLEELSYNSKSNIFFGYTLSELDEQFQDSKYIFTLGDTGETIVEPFEGLPNPYEQVFTNVLVGSGTILVCVTISTVASTVGAPAASMIFAMSAKTGTIAALSSAAFGGISAGIFTGIQTGNIDAALEAATIKASEDFKWGAITGAISGGISEAVALKGATLLGLTMNEAAQIQHDSKLALDVIKNFHSVAEYNIYRETNLQFVRILGENGGLVQYIDWDFVGNVTDGRTNAQRVLDGLSPLDPTGIPYELHHVGQQADSPLAILTNAQHHGNFGILHANTGAESSNIDRNAFAKEKIEFWNNFLELTWNSAK